jgi:hypothetical protein
MGSQVVWFFLSSSLIFFIMNKLLNTYLFSVLVGSTFATACCFNWYIQEYDAAYKYHKVNPEVSQIHRNNSLWLGLWGGIFTISSTVSAVGLKLKKD